MTLPIERARSRRPITWLTLIGVLLLPAIIGGILVTALQNPTDRLESMTAAVVNLDKPVTIDGQYTPLGRQLASGLVKGSDDAASNLTWVISNEEDAAKGLGDGTYQAVVTIPASFSADATSAGTALKEGVDAPKQAKITVTTPPDGRLADNLITSQIADVAASSTGSMISEATIGNVLVGFTTIGDQIGTAADGATKLADGANGLADGADKLAGGLSTISTKAREAGSGATQLGQGLTAGAAQLEQNGIVPDELFRGVNGTAQATAGVADGVAGVKSGVDGLVSACGLRVPGADPLLDQVCAGLTDLQAGLPALSKGATQAKDAAAGTAAGLQAFDKAAPAEIAKQMRTAGTAAGQLGSGLGQLADGVAQSASGASALVSGATQLGGGATTLADGLKTASTSLPSFDEQQSTKLASVIADPVKASASGSMFGPTAIPLLSAVVLWFGALASFIALRAVPGDALTSRRSSFGMVLRGFWPAAALGAGQGLLVSLIVQIVASYDAATWWGFAGFAVLAGVAFAAVNQALVAVLGGIGRWVSALVGVLAVATGLISTIPGWLAGLGSAIPTAPALGGLIAPNGSAFAALVVWAALSLGAATLAVATRRTASTKQVLAAA